MNPKDKAIELANKFIRKSVFDMTDEELKEQREQGKAFAIICVDEILNATKRETINNSGTGIDIILNKYWVNVKQEIEKL